MFFGNKDTDYMILSHLDDSSLCKTNKYARKICRDDNFWKKRVKFGELYMTKEVRNLLKKRSNKVYPNIIFGNFWQETYHMLTDIPGYIKVFFIDNVKEFDFEEDPEIREMLQNEILTVNILKYSSDKQSRIYSRTLKGAKNVFSFQYLQDSAYIDYLTSPEVLEYIKNAERKISL